MDTPGLVLMGLLWCAQAADCYAFGVLMWEMYTSNSAWANMSHAQVVRAVLTNRKLTWPAHVPAPYMCAPRPDDPPLIYPDPTHCLRTLGCTFGS